MPGEPIIFSKLQPALGVFALLAALYVLPLESVGYLLRLLVLLYLVLSILDVLLTRYHRWNFSSTEPKPQPKHVALVTGASSGIGKELAYQLAEHGHSLLLIARNASVLERMQTEIEQVHERVKVSFYPCDLTSDAGINELVAFAATNGLAVDILVNCAGFSVTKDFVQLSQSQVTQIMALDITAVAQLTHAFVPQMLERGVGRVLNMGSMAGSIISPTAALYSSSKAFVINFSQALDYELRGTGVTVTCFCPGPVHTNFGSTAECDDAIYMNISGTACTPKDCAALALRAMFCGQTVAYDTWFASISAFLGACVSPRRLLAAICAVGWNAPSKAIQMLRC
ncbi:putative oxidoreductase YqjQ [Phytophthora citrophthora]|uniref:Oxidoreductase YqjQ n=1 Tax=Phytophthora citrophthora TaxID=4793 RepID=A0AAD9GZA4_9STRA|nr:putative oxidoreductase YqjQ [Phytophthora citrophthora]